MQSGIYKLTFPSGKFYIGKSIDLDTRWKQHADKMLKGKAAENMQREYDLHGFPSAEAIFFCHRDHIDLMEEWLIDQFKGPLMLNATYPKPHRTNEIADLIDRNHHQLVKSTWEHLQQLEERAQEVDELQQEVAQQQARIEEYQRGGVRDTQDWEEQVLSLQNQTDYAYEELRRLQKLSLWDRLFNYKVNL